ncbi:hypothetical protein D3C87_1437450 [compost metagenome]
MLLNGLDEAFSFPDCAGHGFFAPHILAGAGSVGGDNAVPMWWSGYMHNVHLGELDQLAVVGKGFDALIDHINRNVEVPFIHITQCNYFGACVRDMAAAHGAGADDGFGERVARGEVTFPQHMAGNDRKRCQRRQ